MRSYLVLGVCCIYLSGGDVYLQSIFNKQKTVWWVSRHGRSSLPGEQIIALTRPKKFRRSASSFSQQVEKDLGLLNNLSKRKNLRKILLAKYLMRILCRLWR